MDYKSVYYEISIDMNLVGDILDNRASFSITFFVFFLTFIVHRIPIYYSNSSSGSPSVCVRVEIDMFTQTHMNVMLGIVKVTQMCSGIYLFLCKLVLKVDFILLLHYKSNMKAEIFGAKDSFWLYYFDYEL